jgi:hypothetical protein
MTDLRVVDFADLEAGVWGGVWAPPGTANVFGYVRATASAQPATTAQPATLTDNWDISIGGQTLNVEPMTTQEPASLCRVTGSMSLPDGTTCELDCRGIISTRPFATDKVDSIREVAAWLGDRDGFSLLAVRPKGARGHESDAVECTHFEAGAIEHVDEPRLSSTYRHDGTLLRAGVELWLTAQPDDTDTDADTDTDTETDTDPDEREPIQYPRRVQAVATGAAATWVVPELKINIRSELCRWAARGLEGAGVYRLTTRT